MEAISTTAKNLWPSTLILGVNKGLSGPVLSTFVSGLCCILLHLNQEWIKWSCKLYLEGKVQLDLIPIESITCRRIHTMHNGVSSVPYT